MNQLDPTDRDLAKKRAVEAAEADCDTASVAQYIKDFPTLDAAGFPIEQDDAL